MSKRASYFLRLLISLILLAFIFHRVDFSGLRLAFSTAKPIFIVQGLVLILLIAPVLSSVKVLVLLRGQQRSLALSRMLFIDLTSRFYGLLAPSGFGHGAVRWYRLGTEIQDRAAATVCVVFNRLSQTLTVVGIGLLCWLADQDKPQLNVWIFFYGLLAFGLLYGVILTRPVRKLLDFIGRTVLPERASGVMKKLLSSLEKMAGAGLGLHISLLLVSLARQLTLISGSYSFVLALGVPISFYDLGWVSAVGFLAGHLPVSVAEVGVREWTYLTLLEGLGVEPHVALALPLLLSTSALVVAGFGGVLELIQTSVSGKS